MKNQSINLIIKRKFRVLVIAALCLVTMNVFSQDKAKSSENTFKSYWKNGYQLVSKDGKFKMKFGGRIQYDWAYFGQDAALEDEFGSLGNGAEFRRARFFNSGQIYGNIKYKIQLDFTGGKVSFKDVYINISKLPIVGNLKIGHFKEPFRLEALTSSKYITFMERGLPIAMSTERNSGFMIHNSLIKSRLAYQFGVFRNADSYGNAKQANDGYSITSRISGSLIKNDEKDQLLHLGLAYSYRKPQTKEYKIKSRPEAHLGNYYVNTGTIENVNSITHLGTEAALVLGPLSFQAEYIVSTIKTQTATANVNYSFKGYYGQVSYFLTGEIRKYKNYESGFGRVKPKNNFGDGHGGTGAFEMAVRYSGLDLNDKTILGGDLKDITLGLNWYLNPATRLMVNYVLADLNNVGNGNAFQMRFQIDF